MKDKRKMPFSNVSCVMNEATMRDGRSACFQRRDFEIFDLAESDNKKNSARKFKSVIVFDKYWLGKGNRMTL